MNDFLRKNIFLVLAFALPVVFITVVAANVSFRSRSVSTAYNFIYSACTGNSYVLSYPCYEYLRRRYSVVNGRLVVNPVDLSPDPKAEGPLRGMPPSRPEDFPAHIFFHDTTKNESREITLEEAQRLSLNGLLTSPDGVMVSNRYDPNGGIFFLIFSGGSSRGYHLTKGQSRKRLDLIGNDHEIQFISWVLQKSHPSQ